MQEWNAIMTVGAIIVLVVAGIIFSNNQKKRIKNRLNNQFGQKPKQEIEYESVAKYYNCLKQADMVDDITWNDLEMDQIFARINSCLSSVGEEYLYYILRKSDTQTVQQQDREAFIQFLDANSDKRLNLQYLLNRLGKMNYNGYAQYIVSDKADHVSSPWLYNVTPLLLVASIGYAFFYPLGVVLAIACMGANVFLHYRYQQKIKAKSDTFKYLVRMINFSKKIVKEMGISNNALIKTLETSIKHFFRLDNKARAITFQATGEMAAIQEYIKITTLSDLRNYNQLIKMLDNKNQSMISLFEALGEIDVALAILSYRKSVDSWCYPTYIKQNKIEFTEIYHPLIDEAVTNTGSIERNSIITGANASGKSTFIKALAINGILAKSINTCTAVQFTLRHVSIMTSMAVRDNIVKGESYFVTEVKSLKRIIDAIKEKPVICFIDEILKGTNTIERIATSASILASLQQQDCLCIVASHDIELTEIMKETHDNYHFSVDVSGDEVQFDYQFKKGKAETRNAIKLLEMLGFDKQIVNNANQGVHHFETNKSWE